MTITNPNDIPPDCDLLSSLPDHLLVEILSHLPLKSAIVASASSHRWQSLWKQITSIDIDSRQLNEINVPVPRGELNHNCESNYDNRWPRYGSFTTVDYLLKQFTSESIYSLSLHLPCYCYLSSEGLSAQLDSILGLVCARRVERIQIEPDQHCQGCCWTERFVPPCVFQTSTLVSLDLGPHTYFIYKLPQQFDFNSRINLPCLKKLGISLELDLNSCNNLAKLITSCPSLEVLNIEYSQLTARRELEAHILEISSTTLKHLDIRGVDISKVLVRCTLLESLTVYGDYLHLAKSLNNLVYAKILFRKRASEPSQYKNIFNGISIVTSLNLVTRMPERSPLFDALPSFLNLTNLRWFTNSKQLNYLPLLLKSCPALHHFVIKIKDYINEDPLIWEPVVSRFTAEIKRIEFELLLIVLNLDEHLLNCMKFLLCNIKSLERLVVRVTYVLGFHESNEDWEQYQLSFCEELFKCPRASSECKIEFFCYKKDDAVVSN